MEGKCEIPRAATVVTIQVYPVITPNMSVWSGCQVWTKSYSVLDVLGYIKGQMYPDLHHALWDRNLWMYGWIEDWTSTYYQPAWKQRDFGIYVKKSGTTQTGVALTRRSQETKTVEVLADTVSAEALVSLYRILSEQYQDFLITVRDYSIADQVQKLIPELTIEPGKVKLYATEKVMPPSRSIELMAEHQKSIWQEQWTNFSDLLAIGFRFFGVEIGGRIITTAGLWPHTGKHIEIVAVGTDPNYMRKGYAREACSQALNTGLDFADIVTWSTDIMNTASRSLAKSLGFTEYLTTYQLRKGQQA